MKTAIITGASSGLGREVARQLTDVFPDIECCWLIARREDRLEEIAREMVGVETVCLPLDLCDSMSFTTLQEKLAAEGAFVVINYNGSKEAAETVLAGIRAAGGDGCVMQCNVSDFAACEAWMKGILALYGKIDILVNNAGITKDGLLMGMSEEAFDRVIETNLKGTFNCIRFAARPMIRQKSGCIINMASVVGVAGNAGQANYAASKAGVIGLTKTAARELASRGIRVNAIAPGFIETDMTEVLSDKVKEASVSQIPLGHFGKPEDVANLAAFLASEAAAYITGQVIHCDGGMVI